MNEKMSNDELKDWIRGLMAVGDWTGFWAWFDDRNKPILACRNLLNPPMLFGDLGYQDVYAAWLDGKALQRFARKCYYSWESIDHESPMCEEFHAAWLPLVEQIELEIREFSESQVGLTSTFQDVRAFVGCGIRKVLKGLGDASSWSSKDSERGKTHADNGNPAS